MGHAGEGVEYVEVRGRRIAFEQGGQGPGVVFIHGTGTFRSVYGDVTTALGNSCHWVRYDRRGFAATGGPPGSWADHVADAAGLIESLFGEPVTLVGNSAGGVVALEVAAKHPDLVAGLVLAEPAWRTTMTPSIGATWALTRTLGTAWIRRRPVPAATFFYRWATGYEGGGNQYDSYPERWKEVGREHAATAVHELPQLLVPRPSSRAVRAIAKPTTVVIGGRGRPVFRRTSRAVLARMPGADTVTIPTAAHIVNTDDPEAFADAVVSTVRRAAPDPVQ